MRVVYKGYKLPSNETEVLISRNPQLDQTGRLWAYEEMWELRGRIPNPGGSAAALNSKLKALESAFSSNGGDIYLTLPDGVTKSAHWIKNASTIGGVRIARPVQYPEGRGPAYVTERKFTVAIAATIPVDPLDRVTEFSEHLRFSGGGPLFGHLVPAKGPPIKQQYKAATPYRATQSGRATGLYSRPEAPSPIWPMAFQQDRSSVTRHSPRRIGNGFVEYTVEWLYEFESAVPLYGEPSVWI